MSLRHRPLLSRLDAIGLLGGCGLIVLGVAVLPYPWARAAAVIVAGLAVLGLSIAGKVTEP